ncbi:uncharacterized protein LOC109832262 [Asparagus officinalis]|uniref:uncharacterized protein LOC109832262 n=1 Tax=Asparagus officinalis TaxID=4686 RepID=UPI00098E4FBB|nr:uncharacterized protein LOC109832262 [Asparagus officinalis]
MGRNDGALARICCMCGDHGLLTELFRCKSCLIRSQHKYCSNLYPKFQSYRACNWCLRQETKGGNLNDTNHNYAIPSPSNYNNEGSSSDTSRVKLKRGVFPQYLDEAVKKQKMQEIKISQTKNDQSMGKEEITTSLRGEKQVFRGKVRRYKLLEEVA